MQTNFFQPKRAAKAFAGALALGVANFILFGFPGICGTVGGIVPTLFPQHPLWMDYPPMIVYGLTFVIVIPATVLWMLISALLRFFRSHRENSAT